jgi:hypothetical protein
MTKKELFKNIIKQNAPDKDDILANVLTNPVKTQNVFNFKRIIKYSLPALMILTIIFVQIFAVPIVTNQQPAFENTENNAAAQTPKSRNWFGIVAYAADVDEKGEPIVDDTNIGVELKADVKINVLSEFIVYGSRINQEGFEEDFQVHLSKLKLLVLKIDGDNIKTIDIKCETGTIYLGRKIDEVKNPYYSFSVIDGRNFTIKKEDYISWIQWEPTSKLLVNDIITITVTFDDGEQITQIVEVTFDENGDIYAELKDK